MISCWRDAMSRWPAHTSPRKLQTSVLAMLALAASTGASALPISATDLWDVISTGTTVTNSSAVHPNSNINDMFGASLSPVEATNTVFADGLPQGTIHSVEWQTVGDVTLRSFVLNAAHDGPAGVRDANFRGFGAFRLYADDGSGFEEIFAYNPGNPFDTSVAPPNGIVDNIGYGALSLGVNIIPVTADRFRAEFVQLGPANGHADGPRIRELDGFDTFLTSASIPTDVDRIPEPHALALFGLGVAFLGAMRHRRPGQGGPRHPGT
jgi:hypothetical protein